MLTDVGRPSTWIAYKEKNCKSCTARCCSLPVEVKIEDLVRLGLLSEDQSLTSPKKLFSLLRKRGLVISFRAKTGLFTLAQRPNGSCIFLDDQFQCTVYDRRPEVCRLFPKIGPRPGFCPFQPVN